MSTSAERMRRLRARRAAGLLPADDGPVVPEAERIAPAVEETLAALGIGDEDAAIAKLARRYAVMLDEARDPAWAARWIGPLLLEALSQLGATPAARARMKVKPEGPRRPSQLDEMRIRSRRPGVI